MLMRIAAVLPVALLVCGLLMFLMAKLIEPQEQQLSIVDELFVVDFLRRDDRQLDNLPDPIEQIEELLEKPEPQTPDLNVPQLALPNFKSDVGSFEVPVALTAEAIKTPSSLSGLSFDTEQLGVPIANEQEPIALRENALTYPPKALRRRIEGKVVFNYVIEEDGSVSNIEIVESHPPRVFDRIVLREVSRWQYKPRLVNGKPQATRIKEREYVFQLP